MIQEAPGNLDALQILIADFMNLPTIKGQDLGFGIAEEQRRMAGNDELGVFVFAQSVV
jgi:hypothetical protein